MTDEDRSNRELLVLALLVGVIIWGIARIVVFMARHCPKALAVVLLAAVIAGGLVILPAHPHHPHHRHPGGGFCDYVFCKAV
jgi:hypothetical protein